MRSFFTLISVAIALALSGPAYGDVCDKPGWERWQEFRSSFISSEGRVIDPSDERLITTSEGQSYALFFALVDNDPALFQRVLRWTEHNLAGGNLSSNLPAWLWGKKPSGEWGVLDENSAADSDLWIAYALIEAGRLWRQHSYSVLGFLLLQRIAHEEVAELPQLGAMLLPGKQGFAHDNAWKLNPSYLPPQLVALAARMHPTGPWAAMAGNVERLLIDSAPKGLAPDWITWTDGRFESQADAQRISSYDAIRVYLWVGSLHEDAPGAQRLKQHFMPVQDYVDAQGRFGETIDIYQGVAQGRGPAGFSAALLPLLGQSSVAAQLRTFVKSAQADSLGYYNQVLALFGTGWDEGRYRYGPDGALQPLWETCQ